MKRFERFAPISSSKQVGLFDRIDPHQQKLLLKCFTPEYKNYLAGENIIDYREHPERIGVMLSGNAQVVATDADGNNVILEDLSENSVFGELFLLPLSAHGYAVEALTDCRILFIRYSDIIKRCENACTHHSQLVDNLFCMAAIKARNLNMHLQILSRRTTKDKLLCYLSFQEDIYGQRFTLPMTWSRLADYLCVNRSALMREVRRLNEEGLLLTDGKQVVLPK